ncbi:MAG: 16S rRNA (cytosine(1402)-N(4))-methyltransferase RsmH [Bacteroidales bacterium]|jgi:16S rRNA (cytosine1402-N4)-methyltransferase|nr:16S rRNA (cytosine(1402)-N(4))-methyltransferase RsmH [Bacteroidales bacterium]
MYHKSVLLGESVDALGIEGKRDGVFVDATFGGGGHSREILARLGQKGRLIVFDQDEDALANVPEDKRITKIRSNFRFLENYIRYLGVGAVDGVIADLGVSSHQFDTAERGFSYRFDSPLDMRMNTLADLDASQVVGSYSLEALTKIFRDYGEVEGAGKVASAIVSARGNKKIETTGDLRDALSRFFNAQSERKFLGKVFQALRIEVNREMRALEDLLEGCLNTLGENGRLSVITYHSLEDRIVKNFLRDRKADGTFEILSRKPILPSEEEIEANPRSRSAKLRIGERKID